jgi:hypothetical protein
MAIENWIDAVVDVAGSVESHVKGRKVKAYKVASKAEIPEALTVYPCAIVYAPRMKSAQYSMGGPCKELWEVRGTFYIFSDTKKSNIPELIRYFSRIRTATLASLTLGGLVDHFCFAEADPMVMGTLPYEADQPERHVIDVTWDVKSDVTSELTVGG